jgi:hypothetical protein
VTSHRASQVFYDKIVADDKRLSLFEVYYDCLHPYPQADIDSFATREAIITYLLSPTG